MDKFKQHREKIVTILLGVSLAWAGVSTYLFLNDYGRLHRGGYLPGPHAWRMNHLRVSSSTPMGTGKIQPWMTFAFVNVMYSLPPNYLKDTLGITDASYPELTIASAARAEATSSAALIASLKEALLAHSALSASSTSR